MTAPVVLDARATAAALSPRQAVAAIRDALTGSIDPARDVPRQAVGLGGGAELLIMPSSAGGGAGVKIVTVAGRDQPPDGPRIQGQYLLFDRVTLAPRLLLDGAALTAVRTAAVSFAPFGPLLPSLCGSSVLQVVILGRGPQARAHRTTLLDLLPADVIFVSRTSPTDGSRWSPAGSADARRAMAAAHLVVCATTAREPVVDLNDVRDDAVIIAVGSHTPDAREVGSRLMANAQVVVEDTVTALRECGDVVLAVADGSLDPSALVPLRDVVRGEQSLRRDRPVVFKTSGMPWEDLVVAEAIASGL